MNNYFEDRRITIVLQTLEAGGPFGPSVAGIQ